MCKTIVDVSDTYTFFFCFIFLKEWAKQEICTPWMSQQITEHTGLAEEKAHRQQTISTLCQCHVFSHLPPELLNYFEGLLTNTDLGLVTDLFMAHYLHQPFSQLPWTSRVTVRILKELCFFNIDKQFNYQHERNMTFFFLSFVICAAGPMRLSSWRATLLGPLVCLWLTWWKASWRTCTKCTQCPHWSRYGD